VEFRLDHPPANDEVLVEAPDSAPPEFLGYEAAWPLATADIESGAVANDSAAG
jgi:hypothetical protein